MTLFNQCKVIARTAETKIKFKIYHVLRDANQLVLNCKRFERFSYFRPFTHDIITQNISHSNILYLYRGHSSSTSLGKGQGVDEERNTKWHRKEDVQSKNRCPLHKFFYALFSVTQSLSLLGFSWGRSNITASNKKSTSKKGPTSVSEITIYYNSTKITQKYNPTTLSMWVVYTTCASKNSILSQDVIFYLL